MTLARATGTSVASALPIRGRVREVEAIEDAIVNLADGIGGAIWIEGPSGSGKSRLLAHAMTLALRAGLRVVDARGGASGPGMGMSRLPSAMTIGEPPLLDVASASAMHASSHLRYWWVQEIGAALTASPLPVLVCIDDLQFCDPLTRLAARILPTKIPEASVLWLVAQREDVLRSPEPIPRSAGALSIGALSRADAALLVSDVIGGPRDEALAHTAVEPPRLPMLAMSYAKHIRDADTVPSSDPIGARIQRLSPTARAVGEAAAAIGARFTLHALARVMGWAEGRLIGPVMELMDRELVHDSGQVFEFEHELIREWIEANAPTGARSEAQVRALGIAIADRAEPVVIARTALRIAESGEPTALDRLADAIAATAEREADVAARLVMRRVQLIPTDSPEYGPAVTQAVPILWHAGFAEAARELALRRIGAGLVPDEEAELRLLIARLSSLISPSVASANIAAALALPGLTATIRAGLSALRLKPLLYYLDFEGMAQAIPEARALAQSTGNLVASHAIDEMEAVERYYQCDWDRALELVTRARNGPLTYSETWLSSVLRIALLRATGRLEDALATCQIEIQLADQRRQTFALFHLQLVLSNVFLDLGRLDEAQVYAEAVLDMARDIGAGWTVEVGAVAVLVQIAIHRENPDAHSRFAALADQFASHEAPYLRLGGEWIQLLLADLSGDLGAVAALTQRAHVRSRVLAPPAGGASDIADDVYFVRIVLSAGFRDRAEAVQRLSAERARLTGSLLASAVHAHVRGLVDNAPDDLRTAVLGYRAVGRPLSEASALEDLALSLVDDDRASAVALLHQAHSLLAAAGASRGLARLDRLFRALGSSAPARARTKSALGLTAAEERIVERALRDETNAQIANALFLSQNTVTAHLRRIYATLGVRSRAEMISLVRASRASESGGA